MDDLIANSGVSYRAVTNPSFMDNLLRQVESIKNQGVFFLPISGDLKQPSACTRDIAATAARLLLDSSWSEAGSVPVLGPEDLSYNDMARIMSEEVLGKPIRFQEISNESFKSRLMERGLSEAMAHAGAIYSLTVLEPFGVIGAIIPFNWPPIHTGGKIAPALAAGNTVVLKPSEAAPLTVIRIADLCNQVLPPDVLHVVPRRGATVARHRRPTRW